MPTYGPGPAVCYGACGNSSPGPFRVLQYPRQRPRLKAGVSPVGAQPVGSTESPGV